MEEIVKVLDEFGKAGVRLATLLKAEKELDGGQSEPERTLRQALEEVAEELSAPGEKKE